MRRIQLKKQKEKTLDSLDLRTPSGRKLRF